MYFRYSCVIKSINPEENCSEGIRYAKWSRDDGMIYSCSLCNIHFLQEKEESERKHRINFTEISEDELRALRIITK